MTSAAPVRKPYRKAPPQHREIRHDLPVFRDELDGVIALSPAEQCQESLSDMDRIKVLQQQNEDLRRRLAYTTRKMETEFESSRHYMEAEMGRTKDELEKMKDKFRRLQNSYTASQRTNQDLEDKLHALLRKVENDKKTMDQETVELTNKLMDAKNTIDKLEELNERYRQDCNLAVQLLKCNKSHFRNHKFADLPYELQDMVNKHMKTSPPDSGQIQQDLSPSLAPTDVVPTAVIARVLEKPEPLVLNSAQSSSSAGRPMAEDVFVHVDMTGQQADRNRQSRDNTGQGLVRGTHQQQQNGTCSRQGSVESLAGEEGGNEAMAPSFEKLNPYPTPSPPHPLYPGRKVIEFSTDDKVKIPKNSPLPNCTYATRQAISLSLVQGEDEEERQRTMPNSPAVSEGGWQSGASSSSGVGGGCGSHCPPQQDMADLRSNQSSPFSSPPQAPSALASSEEDILSNWQRMFVEKMAPTSEGTLVNRTSFSSETANELQRSFQGKTVPGDGRRRREQQGAYSDKEESVARSWTVSRGSSLDTDNSVAESRVKKGHYNTDCSREESERLLMAVDNQDDGGSIDTNIATTPVTKISPVVKRKEYVDIESAGSSTEEQDILPQELTMVTPRAFPSLEEFGEKPPVHHITTTSSRPQKSPKRMGIHHLHRKDSLTRAQEHGNLLD
ncbi:tight junction-associated protein 1-like [Polyodon spathula]|uniref:tight junction-associated protein 1-like n=1 Tax=Polyodon spathula TaxID=7913 RepID=UPI001B7E248E|nr:tight junction-associated protein 1-like [Polyodon spathula]XP_041105929.1 tight junction-associated protein 1-like [Polyodon spathula]XP_041105930.1 tight junction-associated protein 1-like [Polyodon spathula]XP_041105931.1 tight junction-associated protein 1-like [Polyodon spathula]